VKPTRRPIVVGLLGGIASGKSSVAAILGELGAAILDADAIARRQFELPEVRAALVRRFGPAVAPAGVIDRAVLARATFGDPEALADLEQLIHPRVRSEIESRLQRLLASNEVPAVVLDVPLLLETSPLSARCDLLLYVESPAAERRRRGVELRGWDGEELARREAHQVDPDEKRRRADVVLRNDGSLAELRDRVVSWLGGAGGFAGLPRRAAPARRSEVRDERDDPEQRGGRGPARRRGDA